MAVAAIWQRLPDGGATLGDVTVPPSLRDRKKERTRAALAQAALELFRARGFDAVTLAEVADAAEVGHRTLFRYYPDKEELLFGDDAAVQEQLRTALLRRPADEPGAVAVLEALLGLAPRYQDRRDEGRARRAVIEGAPALWARERAKHAAHERVLRDGLVARGHAPAGAALLARVAVACTDEGVSRWLADDDPERPGLAERVRAAFAEAARELGDLQR